jgi:hypothetical protein
MDWTEPERPARRAVVARDPAPDACLTFQRVANPVCATKPSPGPRRRQRQPLPGIPAFPNDPAFGRSLPGA